MSDLLTRVLPFALGAAISPTVWAVELLILTGANRPRARAWAYVAGFAIVLAGLIVLFTTVLRTLITSASGGPSPWARGLDIAAALVLIALAIRQLIPRRTVGEQHHSRVMEHLESGGPVTYLAIGMVMMLSDASTIILLIPGAHAIADLSDPDPVRLAAAALLYVIVLIPLVIPVGALSLVGHRADALLSRVNAWVTAHQRLINAAVAVLIAIFLLVNAAK